MISIQSKSPNTPYLEYQDAPACTNSIPDPYGLGLEDSESYAVIGAPDEDIASSDGAQLTNAGSAYIYERNLDGSWNKSHKIVSSDAEANDLFGWSTATADGFAVVGAPHEDHDALGGAAARTAGSAYIFEKGRNGEWKERQKIVASDRSPNRQFGISVSISTDYLVVGAVEKNVDIGALRSKTSDGAAYIFERGVNGKWEEVQKIVADRDGVGGGFGYLVSINGDQVIVGARSDGYGAGGENRISEADAVHIYERGADGLWSEQQNIMNPMQTLLLLEKLF